MGLPRLGNKSPRGFHLFFYNPSFQTSEPPWNNKSADCEMAILWGSPCHTAKLHVGALISRQHQLPDAKLKTPANDSTSQTLRPCHVESFQLRPQTAWRTGKPSPLCPAYISDPKTLWTITTTKSCFMPLRFAMVCHPVVVTGTHCLDDWGSF